MLKNIVVFVSGIVIGYFITPVPDPVTRIEYVGKVCPDPQVCPVCQECERGLSPAYVKELLDACRAGKLDQSDPNVTIRK